MLLSLQHYLQEGGLYVRTYSQYGPFYFFAQHFLHSLLNLPVTHDAGRLVNAYSLDVFLLNCRIHSLAYNKGLTLERHRFSEYCSVDVVVVTGTRTPPRNRLVVVTAPTALRHFCGHTLSRDCVSRDGIGGSVFAFDQIQYRSVLLFRNFADVYLSHASRKKEAHCGCCIYGDCHIAAQNTDGLLLSRLGLPPLCVRRACHVCNDVRRAPASSRKILFYPKTGLWWRLGSPAVPVSSWDLPFGKERLRQIYSTEFCLTH
jgi:hypothetical protein